MAVQQSVGHVHQALQAVYRFRRLPIAAGVDEGSAPRREVPGLS